MNKFELIFAFYTLGVVTAPLLTQGLCILHDVVWLRIEDAWTWLTTPLCRVCGLFHHDPQVYHMCSHCAGRGYRYRYIDDDALEMRTCGDCSGTGIAR